MHRAAPPKASLHPWEFPQRPWSRIHIDHAGPYMGHTFLVIVDAHSKWIETYIVPSTSTESTIKVLRTVFAQHGLPETLVSDNGSGFTSQQFAEFLSSNDIKHTRTSPYHPSSNGGPLREPCKLSSKDWLRGKVQYKRDYLISFLRIGSLHRPVQGSHHRNYSWAEDYGHSWISFTQIRPRLL